MLTLQQREEALLGLLRAVLPAHRVLGSLQIQPEAAAQETSRLPEVRLRLQEAAAGGAITWGIEISESTAHPPGRTRSALYAAIDAVRGALSDEEPGARYRLLGGRILERTAAAERWLERVEEIPVLPGAVPQALFAYAQDFAVLGGTEPVPEGAVQFTDLISTNAPTAATRLLIGDEQGFQYVGRAIENPPPQLFVEHALRRPFGQPGFLLSLTQGIEAECAAEETETETMEEWRRPRSNLQGLFVQSAIGAETRRLALDFVALPASHARAWIDYLHRYRAQPAFILVRSDLTMAEATPVSLEHRRRADGGASRLRLEFLTRPLTTAAITPEPLP